MTDPWAGKGFGWQNMFVAPDDDPRDASEPYGERAVLASYLDYQRATLELKCSGLTPEELSTPAVPTSDLTLLGLVQHMATVEYGWFQRAAQGDHGPRPYRPTETPSEEFTLPTPSPRAVAEAFDTWHAQCALSRAYAAATDLSTRLLERPESELRAVIVHMIEEYARHNGHADLIREAIDGHRGE